MECQIAYNPFKVEMNIAVKEHGNWIPISPDSSLMRYSRMRLQRCLNEQAEESFFLELCNSSGDDDIDIYFLGVNEDYEDIQKAASAFVAKHKEYSVNLHRSVNSNQNSDENKYNRLNSILTVARKFKYSYILSDEIWNSIKPIQQVGTIEALLIPLENWTEHKSDIFSSSSWQMFCFEFHYEDIIKGKSVRQAIKGLSKEFENISDRFFERERFIFVCRFNDEIDAQQNVLRRFLMEYGLQDFDCSLISESDYKHIDELDYIEGDDSLKSLQKHILTFKSRYANQYKLRKMVDTLEMFFLREHLVPGAKLKRRIDSILREQSTNKKTILDKDIEETYKWLIDFISNIENILEIE